MHKIQDAHQQAMPRACARVWKIPGLSDLADLAQFAYINLKGGVAFNIHFQSEMQRFYGSNVIIAMNGAEKYRKNIKMYVLRCTTIAFKQTYGHTTSRHADMNLRCKFNFTAKIGQYFVRCRYSGRIVVARCKMTFISIHITANQNSTYNDKSIKQCLTCVFCPQTIINIISH